MDIKALGHVGFESPNAQEWESFGPRAHCAGNGLTNTHSADLLLRVHPRNTIDLDLPPGSQHGLDRCPCREIVFEELPVYFVHGIKIVEIGEKYRYLQNVLHAAVGSFQNVCDIG
jgi:hypothetical protein